MLSIMHPAYSQCIVPFSSYLHIYDAPHGLIRRKRSRVQSPVDMESYKTALHASKSLEGIRTITRTDTSAVTMQQGNGGGERNVRKAK